MSKSPKELALDILARRDNSEKEMRAKLRAKKINQETIDEVIAWLIGKRLLNDTDFAQKKAESIMRTKLCGPKYIANKLREAGVASHVVEEIIWNIADSEEWQKRAHKAIIQWQKAHPKHKDDKIRQMRFLAGRGFDPSSLR